MKTRFACGNGPGFYSYGATIPGRLAESVVLKLKTELVPVKERNMTLLNSLDSLIESELTRLWIPSKTVRSFLSHR